MIEYNAIEKLGMVVGMIVEIQSYRRILVHEDELVEKLMELSLGLVEECLNEHDGYVSLPDMPGPNKLVLVSSDGTVVADLISVARNDESGECSVSE